MAKGTTPVPQGLHSVTTQLVLSDAMRAIDFYKKAFGAEVGGVMHGPDGKSVMHGHVRIGDSVLFLSDVVGFAKPTTANLFLYVADVDTTVARAIESGAKALAPVADMFWGDRWGMIEDPFGNVWQVATHIEDVSPDDMKKRAQAMAPRP